MLDARRMQMLRAVVTSGSVSAAADNLGYTPSAISQQVSTLEREAGTPLLEKIGRGVRPTPAGALLAERAGQLAELLRETETELADIRAGRTGSLRVRFFQSASTGLIPQAVAKFRTKHPEVRLELRVVEEGVLRELSTGDADIAVIVMGREVPAVRGVRVLHLTDEPFLIVLPHGHPLSTEECLDLAQLSDERWIYDSLVQGACAEMLSDVFASAGFTPHVALETESSYAVQAFVAAGLGISLIPRLGLEFVHPGVVVRPVRRPEPMRRLHIAVREAIADQPVSQALLAALFATAGR
jgi:DNA-binding transcriptional LysR family regulator